MAKTISNFLVGVGFDLDKKSADGVASGIDSIKSKALQLGAIVGGAFGIKALTSDFAASRDSLGKFAEVFGGTADEINAFGNALRLEGGTLEGFMSQLASLEQFRAGLATGDTGFLEAAGRAGLDTRALVEAETATEGFLSLADQFQNLTRKQRIAAAEAIGLDEASIRLLSKGRDSIQEIVDVQRQMRPVTEEMTDVSAEFNDQMQNLGTNIGGVADQISVRLLPQINNVLAGMNEWIMANDELLDSGIDGFFSSIEEVLGPIAASIGLISSGVALSAAGGLTAKAGGAVGATAVAAGGAKLASAGGVLSRLGLVGAAGAGGLVVGDLIRENLISQETQDLIGGVITQALANLGSEDAQRTLDAHFAARAAMPPVQVKTQLVLDGRIIDERVVNTVGQMADQAVQDLQSSEGG